MLRFIARRLALALITLLLLSAIVFAISNVLPQDVGRSILGPFAPQESVDALNHKLGTDRPRLEQYIDLLKGIVTFDFGDSYQSGQPVGDLIKTTLQNSAKLAILALLITVPLGIFAGTMAALRRDTVIDRVIVMLGLAGSSLPAVRHIDVPGGRPRPPARPAAHAGELAARGRTSSPRSTTC